MPPKRGSNTVNWVESPDPMLAPDDRKISVQDLVSRWPDKGGLLAQIDFKKFLEDLKAKPAGEKWFIVKNVATLATSGDNVPYVPNLRIVKYVSDTAKGFVSPRIGLLAATKDEWHDPEAYLIEELHDLAGDHEWRPLEGHEEVRVLLPKPKAAVSPRKSEAPKREHEGDADPAAKRARTDAGSAGFNFGVPAAPAAAGFNFGAPAAPAAAAAGFNFGAPAAPAAAAEGFNFNAPAAGAGFNFGAAAPGAASSGGFNFAPPPAGAYDAEDDIAPLPLLVRTEEGNDTVKDMRDSLNTGAKIVITNYKFEDGRTRNVVLDNDSGLLLPSMKQVLESKVEKMLETAYYKMLDEWKQLNHKFQGPDVPLQKSMDPAWQAEYNQAKEALEEQHKAAMKAFVKDNKQNLKSKIKEICKHRDNKLQRQRAGLTALKKAVSDEKYPSRDTVFVAVYYPEKFPGHGDFRASDQVGKVMGDKADYCYPAPYVWVNPLLAITAQRLSGGGGA